MVRRAAPVIAAVVALVLAATTGCVTGRDQQPSGRSGSPGPAGPPVTTASPTRPASSTGGAATTPSRGSGLTGRTVIDGGCPVIKVDSPCPDRPVRAHLNILDAATGTVAASVDTDAAGGFVVPLPPDRYLVRPDQLSGAPPRRPAPATVIVKPGQYTTVTIRFDSGIR